MISAHVPTEVASEDEKADFYEHPRDALNRYLRHEIKFIAGDFNARIGKESYYKPSIGLYSLHDKINGNGTRLINLVSLHDLDVGSTLYPYWNIYKGTWRSPNEETVNQIDHILINARNRSNLQDVRTFRGANVDCDYQLVVAHLRDHISLVKKQ